jgi:hypothetical protein
MDNMKSEFCTRCNTKRNVMMTSSSSVMTAPNGDRRIIQTDFFHCELCKSFVRSEDRNRGALLETDENFTPQAKNIWRAVPGDIQLKILNTVWCIRCRNMTAISNICGKVDSGMLVLRGECTRCGGEVARVIQNE